MNPPDQNPKLPMWIFFLTDAVLLGAAWFIAVKSARPLSTEATFAIFGCIFAGALLLLVPLIARFERQKNEALDERQRELEALARTVSASAEQISIAAKGLHEIAEITQKNVRHAEQLPHKLQEKIAEFQAQIANVTDAEKDELEKEVETLRASESEKLESIASKIARSVADWTKLEAAVAQHLSAANDAISKLSFGTASAIGKAQVAAEQALGQARVEAARVFGEASGNAIKSVDAAKAAALAEIEGKVARSSEPSASTHEAKPGATAAAAVDDGAIAITAPEPPPILAGKITEIAPVAPDTVDPFAMSLMMQSTAGALPTPARTNGEPMTPAATKPARKRAAKKAPSDAPGLEVDEPSSAPDADSADGVRAGVNERIITSDGATRLLVTAYIGIGNRLFIRGEGPGLSWDKGVPLQFVSIGKWRWETNDAAGTVKFKLFKNDDLECSALGAQSLDPGHQQEVTAAF